MGLIEATTDIDVARDAIASATSLEELKQQLVDNLFPVVKGLAEATAEELVGFTEVIKTITDDIDELREGEGEFLYPETTQKIIGVLETGAAIANELELLLGKADNAAKKRINALIKSYRQGKSVVTDELAAITVPVEPEVDEPEATDDAEPADGDEVEGDDGDDDADEAPAGKAAR